MRRTKEQAAETGRQILAAAENLFLDKGYDNVTLDEIASAAGVTRGAVHWHFKNKQGLVEALRNAVQEPFFELAETLSETEGTASLDHLGEVVSEMFQKLDDDPRQRGLSLVVMGLDIAKATISGESGSTFHTQMRVTFQRIFQSIDRDGGLSPQWPPQKAAAMFAATIGGLAVEWALGSPGMRLSEDGSDLVRAILRSWRPES